MKRRIDLDNAIKATLDVINGLGWEDDSQIVKLSAEVGNAIRGGAVSVSYTKA